MNISDIARMAGVSKGTVSRVINQKPYGMSEETRKHIQQIMDEVGYVPNSMARSISLSETKVIGLIIPDVENPFFPQIVRGVEDYAFRKGYTVYLCNSDLNIKKENNYLHSLIEKRVDGIILNTSGEQDDDKLEKLLEVTGIPIILMDRKTECFRKYPGVFIDNEKSAYEGAKHLIANGCSKIAFLGGEKKIYTVQKRYEGYRKALNQYGLEEFSKDQMYGKLSIESGYERAVKMFQKTDVPDAIFAGADVIAIGVLRAAREAGICVPDQLQVLGFDNISLCDIVTPSLTTVAQPIYEMGKKAAQLLLSAIQNSDRQLEDIILPAELVIRNSTKGQQDTTI